MQIHRPDRELRASVFRTHAPFTFGRRAPPLHNGGLTEHSTLAPLRRGQYRSIWLTTLASYNGIWIQSVAAAWAMTLISDRAELVALVLSASTLPTPVMSLLGGALCDSWGRRPVYLLGQASMLLGIVALAALEFSGRTQPWSLLVLSFVVGCGNALRQPAAHASAGDLVPPSELPTAVTLNSISFNIARSLGPAVGGLLVSFCGVHVALAIAALLNVPALPVLLRWKAPKPSQDARTEPLLRAIGTGIAYAVRERPILAVLVRCSCFTVLASAVWALLPVIARDLVDGGATTYGMLLGSIGVGALLCGVLLVGRLRQRLGSEGVAVLSYALFALATLTPALTSHLALIVPAFALGGAAWMSTQTTCNVLVQRLAEPWVRSRAIALYLVASFGALGLGGWAWGRLTDIYGIRTVLIIAGLLMAASTMLGRIVRLPALPASRA